MAGLDHLSGVWSAEVHQGREGEVRDGVDGGDDGLFSEPVRREVTGEGEGEGETTIRRGFRGIEEIAPGEEGEEREESSRREEREESGGGPCRTMARGRCGRERGVFRPEGGGRARRRTMLREAMPPCLSAVVASPNICVIRGWLRRAAISPPPEVQRHPTTV